MRSKEMSACAGDAKPRPLSRPGAGASVRVPQAAGRGLSEHGGCRRRVGTRGLAQRQDPRTRSSIVSQMIRVRGRLDVGDHAIIDDFCYFAADVRLGRYAHIAHGVTVLGGGWSCTVGDFTAIGPGVRILCASDDYDGGIAGPRIPAAFKRRPRCGDVRIGRHCVIGANSVILPGTVIPDGVAVGALSLVGPKSRLQPYGLYAGSPARFPAARH